MLLQTMIENTPAAVAMFDMEMRYIACSRRWLRDYQLGNRDLKGLSHYAVSPEIGEEWKERLSCQVEEPSGWCTGKYRCLTYPGLLDN